MFEDIPTKRPHLFFRMAGKKYFALKKCESKLVAIVFRHVDASGHSGQRRADAGDGQQVDFSKTMVFMTSNLGASEMQHAADGSIGFVNNISNRQENLTTIAMNAARKRFSPEFLNRFDEILVFHPLPASQLRQVVDIEIGTLELRLQRATGSEINLRLSDQAVDFLLER